MQLTPPEVVDNFWAFLGSVITVAGTLAWGIWNSRLARRKDKEEHGSGDSRATIAYLLAENADKTRRLDELEHVTVTKYPLALDHISVVHRRFPNVREQVPIPRMLQADIERREQGD